MNTTLQNIKQAWSLEKNLRTLFIRENERWAFLDGYKAVGIFWVIIGHCFAATKNHLGAEQWQVMITSTPVYLQWVFNGDIAVDAFFMISAFLMTNLLIKHYQETGKATVKLFYLSRFLRLTPAYFLALTVYAFLPSNQGDLMWPNFFYIQNFFNDFDVYFVPLTWSLAVEEQFYLLLPMYLFLVLLKSKHPFLHLISLLIASLLIRGWVIMTDDILSNASVKQIIFDDAIFSHQFVTEYDNLYTRFGAFIGGMVVAYAYRFHLHECKALLQSHWSALITTIAMAIALYLMFIPALMEGFEMSQWYSNLLNICRKTVVCLCAAWLLFCGLFSSRHARRFNAVMSLKVFYPFGNLLYCMYLFHYIGVTIGFAILIMVLNAVGVDYTTYFFPAMFAGAVFSILASMTIAMLIFVLLEAPIMNLRPKYHS